MPPPTTSTSSSAVGSVAVAACLDVAREREARADRLVVEDEDAAEHLLALLLVAAEEARQAEQEGALGGERVGVVRVELERPVDLVLQLPETHHRRDLL